MQCQVCLLVQPYIISMWCFPWGCNALFPRDLSIPIQCFCVSVHLFSLPSLASLVQSLGHLGHFFWVLFTKFGKFSRPIISAWDLSLSFWMELLSRCKIALLILSFTLHKFLFVFTCSCLCVLNTFFLSVFKRCNPLFRCFLDVSQSEAWVFIVVLHLKKFCLVLTDVLVCFLWLCSSHTFLLIVTAHKLVISNWNILISQGFCF